jgi:hypothetical protein
MRIFYKKEIYYSNLKELIFKLIKKKSDIHYDFMRVYI